MMRISDLPGSQLNTTLSKLRQGDAVVLDIDSLLLRQKSGESDEETLTLLDKSLPDLLRYLQKTGHLVILHSTHQDALPHQTISRLEKLGLKHDTYIFLYAPKHQRKILIEKMKAYSDTFAGIKRLVIVNEKAEQLVEVENALKDSGIERLYYHYQPNTQLLTDADRPSTFPATLHAISHPESLGGGTQSTFKVYEDQQRKAYVLKFGSSQAQIKIEILMNILYKRLGIAIPKIQAYRVIPPDLAKSLGLSRNLQTVQLSEYLDAADRQDEDAIIRQARDDFITHAFMGNIDITKTENFIQTKKGEIKLIDAGANFLFKSLGQSREEESHTVNEILSMRDPNKNPSGAIWFRTLTDEDIKNQVKALIKKHRLIEKTIWDISQQLELPASLQQQLLAAFSHRLDDLAQHYGFATQAFAKRDKAAIKDKTAAGVLHLQYDERGELCALLSTRYGHNWCDNFGGKSDEGDNTLAHTAQREVKEESNGELQYSDKELAEAAFHDIITIDEEGKQYLYRMYFVTASQPADIKKLHDAEHTAHHWVPLKNLQTALQQDQKILEENKVTIRVSDMNGNELIVFPPLYEMLKQEPVLTLIDAYIKGKFAVTRTQGLADNIRNEEDKKNPYRPLASPAVVKADIVAAQLHKARALDAIKHLQPSSPKKEPDKKLTQSEFHLKNIMQNDFIDDAPIATNVRIFVDKYQKQNLSEEEKEKLIAQATEMIEREKAHLELVFFYHGVSSEVAYAYQVYTALYRILAADSSLDALRTDNALFHKCLDIQSFITHFQSFSDSKEIYNYSTGYMECALSTNLFVFGNHDNLNSNAINYYTSNSTLATINLKEMLTASLKSMGISDGTINNLSTLANEFPQNNQGSLYQIGLPRDEVGRYAYLASEQGILNPLPASKDKTTDVSRLLASIQNQEDIPLDYIKHLQARIMTPPDSPITVNHYLWGRQVNPDKQQSFDEQLNKLADDMAYDILMHRNQFNKLNSKSALMRYLPDIMQQTGIIRDEHNITDELVVQLVEAGDFESIKAIVEIHPEYKQKVIVSVKRGYSGLNRQVTSQATLLERCLAVQNSGEAIRAIFGNHFYEGILNALEFHQVVAALSVNERYDFAINHQDRIRNSHYLVLVLDTIPLKIRTDLANKLIAIIQSTDVLSCILRKLPEDERFDFATTHADKIQDGAELTFVMQTLPADKQFAFATTHADKIKDGYQLLYLVRKLPQDKQTDFADAHANKVTIQDVHEFTPFLTILSADKIQDFLNTHANNIIKRDNDLLSIAAELPEDKRFDFAIAHADKIKKGKLLSTILDFLPEDKRLDLGKVCADKIKDTWQLIIVMGKLPKDKQFDFVNSHADKIKDGEDLFQVLDRLPTDKRFDFATTHVRKIQDDDGLSSILFVLPENKRADFKKIYAQQAIPSVNNLGHFSENKAILDKEDKKAESKQQSKPDLK
jgi:hypothetical protein